MEPVFKFLTYLKRLQPCGYNGSKGASQFGYHLLSHKLSSKLNI